MKSFSLNWVYKNFPATCSFFHLSYCFNEVITLSVFFFQAEDGIRDVERSRGLEMCIRDSISW